MAMRWAARRRRRAHQRRARAGTQKVARRRARRPQGHRNITGHRIRQSLRHRPRRRPHPANSARNALDSGAITAEDFDRIRQPRHHVRTLLGTVIRKDITTAPSLAPAYWLPRHRRDWPARPIHLSGATATTGLAMPRTLAALTARFDLKTSASPTRSPRSGPFLGPEPAVDVMALRSVRGTAA